MPFLTSLLGKRKILFLNYDHKIKCGSKNGWNGFENTRDLFTKYLDEFDVYFFNYQDVVVTENQIYFGDISINRFSFVFFGFISKNTDLFNIVRNKIKTSHIPYLMYGNTRDNDNKINDLSIFTKYNVPHIPTILATRWNKQIENIKLPVVIKPYNGSCGNGVVKFETYSEVETHLNNTDGLKLIQTWVKNNGDYRIITFNNQAIIHSKRIAKEGEWRNNVAQGGSVTKSDLPQYILKKAEEISKAFESNIIGFDIIQDQETGNYLFMEINAGPHYFSFMEENKMDLPKIICDYIKSKLDYRIFIYR